MKPVKGKDLKKDTEVEGGVFSPSFSKDGEKVAVSGYKEGRFSIFLFSSSELKGKEIKSFSSKLKLIAEYHQKEETKFKDYFYQSKIKMHCRKT